jgi:hypothetical protein
MLYGRSRGTAVYVGRSPLLGKYISIKFSECPSSKPSSGFTRDRVVLRNLELHRAMLFVYIILARPSKSDSAPVRGDLVYEPTGLRIQQSQRRDVTQRAGGSWCMAD